ncbi:MAG: head GIN domain-containing protein [Sphingomicrobium sp.]
MRKSIALAAVAACTAVSGCGRVHAEDGGASISRTYQVGNFQKIEVAGPYDVEVRTGANPSVSARGSEKLLGRTVVEVRGDRLLIRPEQNKGWFHFGWSTHGHANFRVTVPQLSGATIAGSGDIKVDKVQGDRFEGTVAGSGGIDVGAMNVQTLKLAIAGSGSAKAGSGKAQSADYDIAGSGDLDAGGIQTQQAKVSIAGSGSVKAHATGSADVSIMGSGDVDVSGGAKCSVSKAGSGDVRCS